MKKLILGLLLLMSIFVSADEEYNDNGVLNMDEFLLVDQLTLNDFDEVYLYQETELSDEVYFFEMNIFQDYWEYDEETEKEIVYVVPARLQFIFECNINLDCNSEYSQHISELKEWWLQYYVDLKEDYV